MLNRGLKSVLEAEGWLWDARREAAQCFAPEQAWLQTLSNWLYFPPVLRPTCCNLFSLHIFC